MKNPVILICKSVLRVTSVIVLLIIGINVSVAQNTSKNGEDFSLQLNTITTAVPFLLIAPDSRSGAMGDAGVSTSPDANSIAWNPSKLAFAEKNIGIAVSYTPWLRNLVPDINLSYLTGYKKIDKTQAIGASLRYFTLGDIQFTDEYGQNTIQFRPNEFAVDVAYSRKLSDRFSGGMAIRYIYSNLTGGINVQGAESKAGQAVAADISGYYQNEDITLGNKDAILAAGFNVSNIGNKMNYTQTSKRDFIPINLRIGPRLTINLDEYNSIAITTDINKLLVPTTPSYSEDSLGQAIKDNEGNYIILSGKDPDRSVAAGMFGSFTDAPGTVIYNSSTGEYEVVKGSRFKEELHEIMLATGVEYWYDNQLALRAGYFYEHATKGNRKYITLGAGLRYKVFGLDFSYLIPVNFSEDITTKSPLENTLRFTLKFDLDAFKSQEGEEPSIE